MIQPIRVPRNIPEWQQALARAFTRASDLLDFLELPRDLPSLPPVTARDFPLRVPRAYAARMRKGDPHDPLFLQVWTQVAEAEHAPGYRNDAVGDLHTLRPGGILHKYQGRALVIATGACAIHCRYCFRRHFPYGEVLAARDHWQNTLRELAADRSIHEVILSGGDPLSLPDEKLAEFAQALEFIPHVRRLRLHTRQPVVLPERVDEALLAWLGRGRIRKVMVLHVNHAQELDGTVTAALARLRRAGVPLLNQSVLLRGINDRPDRLIRLSEALGDAGVMTYYLHMLDRVQGAAHYEVPEHEARALLQTMTVHLPGYLVPRLVREDPGAPSKTLLAG
ncbi:MAG: EF-P beta-lysylation protein EpmB [Nevskiales bacterium]|nr:EF-P beta-lysylation protein EpmB [Nevskiales bacterium]